MIDPAASRKRIIALVAWIVPANQRDDWREEWCAELDAMPSVRVGNILRGALVDATLLRIGATDQWQADTRAAIALMRSAPLGLGAATWIGALWFATAVLLTTLAADALAAPHGAPLAAGLRMLASVGAGVIAGAGWATIRAMHGVLLRLSAPPNERQRLVVVAAISAPALAIGQWLVVLAFRVPGEAIRHRAAYAPLTFLPIGAGLVLVLLVSGAIARREWEGNS